MNKQVMTKETKQAMKVLLQELNKKGYFINLSDERKNVFYVMSQNPTHDTLLYVWHVIGELYIANISVHRCPDHNVVQVRFEL